MVSLFHDKNHRLELPAFMIPVSSAMIAPFYSPTPREGQYPGVIFRSTGGNSFDVVLCGYASPEQTMWVAQLIKTLPEAIYAARELEGEDLVMAADAYYQEIKDFVDPVQVERIPPPTQAAENTLAVCEKLATIVKDTYSATDPGVNLLVHAAGHVGQGECAVVQPLSSTRRDLVTFGSLLKPSGAKPPLTLEEIDSLIGIKGLCAGNGIGQFSPVATQPEMAHLVTKSFPMLTSLVGVIAESKGGMCEVKTHDGQSFDARLYVLPMFSVGTPLLVGPLRSLQYAREKGEFPTKELLPHYDINQPEWIKKNMRELVRRLMLECPTDVVPLGRVLFYETNGVRVYSHYPFDMPSFLHHIAENVENKNFFALWRMLVKYHTFVGTAFHQFLEAIYRGILSSRPQLELEVMDWFMVKRWAAEYMASAKPKKKRPVVIVVSSIGGDG